MRKLFTTFAAVCALALPVAAAIGVTTYPLPEGCVIGVSPAQGVVDLAGSASPLGVTEITFTFVSNQITINHDLKETIKLYIDGAEEPAEEITAAAAYVDKMENPLASFKFNHKYVDPGLYRITVPAGLFTCSGEPSQAIELGYEIYIPWEVTPAPGSYKELSEWIMHFPDYNEVHVLNNGSFYLALGADEGIYTLDSEVIEEEGVYPNKLRLTLSRGGQHNLTATTPGDYRFFFRAGALELVAYGAQYFENPEDKVVETTQEIQLAYWIQHMEKPTIEPAEGEVTNFLRFNITFPESFNIMTIDDKSNGMGIYRVLPDGRLANERICLVKPINREGNVVSFAVCNPTTGQPMRSAVNPGPGRYALMLPQQLLFGVYNGNYINSDPATFIYTIPTPIFDITTSPASDTADVLDELKEVTITFPVATNMAVNPFCVTPATVTDEAGNVQDVKVDITMEGAISPLAEDSETAIKADVVITPPIVKAGKYTINIPETFFGSGDVTSPAYTLTYNVSGKLNSFAELEAAGKVDVFTTTGIQLLNGADKAAFEELPAGLYIVNGQKVIKR